MQAPFDTLAKAIIDATLGAYCDVALEEGVSADELFSDAVVDPKADGLVLRTRGLLGRMATEPCVIEAYSSNVSKRDVDRCCARASWHRAQRGDDRLLWIVTPSVARAVLDCWKLRRRGWPEGVYVGAHPREPRIVVLAQLARSRSTLLLRLMSRGVDLQRAIEDVGALPERCWEREFVAKLLVRVGPELARMTGDPQFAEEWLMRYAQLVREADEILAAARAEGEALGEARGEARGEADALRTVLAARGFELSRAHSDRIDQCSDLETLRSWLRRAVTVATVNDVFAVE